MNNQLLKEKICKNCIYWLDLDKEFIYPHDREADLYHGICRRYPPMIDQQKRSTFPTTHKTIWCGEFKPTN